MKTSSHSIAESTIRRFALDGVIKELVPITQGHINETWLSVVDGRTAAVNYVHQRINPLVFPNPTGVMANIKLVTSHLLNSPSYHYQVLTLIPTKEQEWWLRDEEGAVWRTYRFIERSIAYDVCPRVEIAESAGRAFGSFLRVVSEIPVSKVVTPIPGFQNLAGRFRVLDDAFANGGAQRREAAACERPFIEEWGAVVERVSALMADTSLVRITHSDTKLNNVLFERQTSNALCVIDLDTVMPGSPLYDFGDFTRLVGVNWPEDGEANPAIPVEFEALRGAVSGFLAGVGPGYFSDREIPILSQMPGLLSLTLGVRFLADYLDGDRYFRVSYDNHNLIRARCQFAIARAFFREESRLRDLIEQEVEQPCRH